MKRLSRMKKYNEDYFSVIEIKTGRKIVDCGLEEDALAMVALDPRNRSYTRNKFLMGPVVDVEIPKQLPTSEIVINTSSYKEHQETWMSEKINQLPQIKLPEGQGIPVNAK
jgi:hypothetical protein